MSKGKRRYSADFKLNAVSRLADCANVVKLAEELGIRRKFLYLWRDQLQAYGKSAFDRPIGRPKGSKSKESSPPPPSGLELRVLELERLLGRKQLELDFFKRTFEQVRGAALDRINAGGTMSIKASKPRSHSKGQG